VLSLLPQIKESHWPLATLCWLQQRASSLIRHNTASYRKLRYKESVISIYFTQFRAVIWTTYQLTVACTFLQQVKLIKVGIEPGRETRRSRQVSEVNGEGGQWGGSQWCEWRSKWQGRGWENHRRAVYKSRDIACHKHAPNSSGDWLECRTRTASTLRYDLSILRWVNIHLCTFLLCFWALVKPGAGFLAFSIVPDQ
jgi:hypothetical protein